MDSKKAIWLCEVLEEQESIILNWRVLKKYSEDVKTNKNLAKDLVSFLG